MEQALSQGEDAIPSEVEQPVDKLRRIFTQVDNQRLADLESLAHVPDYNWQKMSEADLDRLSLEERAKIVLQEADFTDQSKLFQFVTNPRIKRILGDLSDPAFFPKGATLEVVKDQLRSYHLGDLLATAGVKSLGTVGPDPWEIQDTPAVRGPYLDLQDAGIARRRAIFLALGNNLGVNNEFASLLSGSDFREVINSEYAKVKENQRSMLLALNLATNRDIDYYTLTSYFQADLLQSSDSLGCLWYFTGSGMAYSMFYENYPDRDVTLRLLENFDLYIHDVIELYDKWDLRRDITFLNEICGEAIATRPPEEAVEFLHAAESMIRNGRIYPPEVQRYQFISLFAGNPKWHKEAEYLEWVWPEQTRGIVEVTKEEYGQKKVSIRTNILQERLKEAQWRERETAEITVLMSQRDTQGRLGRYIETLEEKEEVRAIAAELGVSLGRTKELPRISVSPITAAENRDAIRDGMPSGDRKNYAYDTRLHTDMRVVDGRLRQNVWEATLQPDSSLTVKESLALGEYLFQLRTKGELPLEALIFSAEPTFLSSEFLYLEEERVKALAAFRKEAALFLETKMGDSPVTIPNLQEIIDNLRNDGLTKEDKIGLKLLVDSLIKTYHLKPSEDPRSYSFKLLLDSKLASTLYPDEFFSFHGAKSIGGPYRMILAGDPVVARALESWEIKGARRKGNILLLSAPAGSGKSSSVRAMATSINMAYIGGLGMVDKLTVPISEEGNSAYALKPREAESDYVASTFGSGGKRLGFELKKLFRRPSTDEVLVCLDEILTGTITPERVRLAAGIILTFGELFPNVTWVVISHDTQRYFRLFKLLELIDEEFPHVQTFAIHPETHQPIPETIADGLGIHVAKREGMPMPVIRIAKILEEAVETNQYQQGPVEVGEVLTPEEEISPTDESFITEEELKMLGFDKSDLNSGIFAAVNRACLHYFLQQKEEERQDPKQVEQMIGSLTKRYAEMAVSLLTKPKTADIKEYYRLFPKFRKMAIEDLSLEVKKAASIADAISQGPFGDYDKTNADVLEKVFADLKTGQSLRNIVQDLSLLLNLTTIGKEELQTAVSLLEKNGSALSQRLAREYVSRTASFFTSLIDEEKLRIAIEKGEVDNTDFLEKARQGENPLEILHDYLMLGETEKFTAVFMAGCNPEDFRVRIYLGSQLDDIAKKITDTTSIFKEAKDNPELSAQRIAFSASAEGGYLAMAIHGKDLNLEDISLRGIMETKEKEAFDKFQYYSNLYFYSVCHGAITRKDNQIGKNWNKAQKIAGGGYPVVKLKDAYDIGLYEYLRSQGKAEQYIPRDSELPQEAQNIHLLAYRGPNMSGKTQGMITEQQMFIWDRLGDGLVPAEECILREVDALQTSVNTAQAFGRLSTYMAESCDKAAKAKKALYFGRLGKRIFAILDEPFNGIGEQDKAVMGAALATIYREHYLGLTNHDPLLNLLFEAIRVDKDKQELLWSIATMVPGFKIGEYSKTDLAGSYSDAATVLSGILKEIGYPPEFVDHITKDIVGKLRRLDEISEEELKKLGY